MTKTHFIQILRKKKPDMVKKKNNHSYPIDEKCWCFTFQNQFYRSIMDYILNYKIKN